ncbi:hypothetical protein ACFL6Y_09045 [Elusimicrobiota bacterium]
MRVTSLIITLVICIALTAIPICGFDGPEEEPVHYGFNISLSPQKGGSTVGIPAIRISPMFGRGADPYSAENDPLDVISDYDTSDDPANALISGALEAVTVAGMRLIRNNSGMAAKIFRRAHLDGVYDLKSENPVHVNALLDFSDGFGHGSCFSQGRRMLEICGKVLAADADWVNIRMFSSRKKAGDRRVNIMVAVVDGAIYSMAPDEFIVWVPKKGDDSKGLAANAGFEIFKNAIDGALEEVSATAAEEFLTGNLRAGDGATRSQAYMSAVKRRLLAAGARQAAINVLLGAPVRIDSDKIEDTLENMGVSDRMAGDISRITFRKMPNFYPEGTIAMSLGREILLKDPHPEDKELIVHEWVHSQQQLDKGFLPFLADYFSQYLTKDYEDVSHEQEAFDFQQNLGGNTPH